MSGPCNCIRCQWLTVAGVDIIEAFDDALWLPALDTAEEVVMRELGLTRSPTESGNDDAAALVEALATQFVIAMAALG